MLTTKKRCASWFYVWGIGTAIGAPAAWGQQVLEPIVVTGSAIKRVPAESASPLEIYDRQDIQRSGATTVNELVKNIASLDVFDDLEVGGSPYSGTAKIQMRGLSARNVLVLLNGRRLPQAPVQDNGGGLAAVDINNIPLSAIDRIEILKDGASAIYGADAIAGVVNFVTRKTYKGIEVGAGYGQSSRSDGQEKTVNVVFGVGDYEAEGFNLMASLDVFKRDPVRRSARDITRSTDWSRFAGGNGIDARSPYHPVGNIVAGPDAPSQVRPCPTGQLVNGLCLYDANGGNTDAINGADRSSGMLIGSLKLGPSLRAFTEVLLSESKDHFETPTVPVAYAGLDDNTYLFRPLQLGPRITDRRSTLANFVTGLEGRNAGVDWDVALGHSRTRTSLNAQNYLGINETYDAIDNGLFDPTSTTNPAAVIDAIRLSPQRDGKATLTYVNAKGSGQLMALPAGPLAYAVGLSLGRETLTDRPDENLIADNVFGTSAQSAVDASRQSQAVFGELSVPLFRGAEAQVALRHDWYNKLKASVDGNAQPGGGGIGKTSPKVAIRYEPVKQLLLRASYAESFMAPTLKQLFGGSSEGFEVTNNQDICNAFPGLAGACSSFPYVRITRANAQLKPEIGKTMNLGFVLDPTDNSSLAIDYFAIRKRDEIGVPTVPYAVAGGATDVQGGEAVVFTDSTNLSKTRVSGFDVDARGRLGMTPWGRLSVRNTLTYYRHIRVQPIAGDPFDEYVGSFGYPRWRNSFSVNLEGGGWSTTANLRMVSHMVDSDSPRGAEAPDTRMIDSHEELDLMVAYTGIKGLTLSGGVKNVLDREPPYSDTGTQSQYGALGFAPLYSPRGRFFFLGARYAF
jgi:iron complex outermembrane receptor protein